MGKAGFGVSTRVNYGDEQMVDDGVRGTGGEGSAAERSDDATDRGEVRHSPELGGN